MNGYEILKLPMGKNDADAKTIGEYLIKLSQECWFENEGFSGKRPFGNSGWDYEIYIALVENKAIDGIIDEDGFIESITEKEEKKGNALIRKAYDVLYEFVQ